MLFGEREAQIFDNIYAYISYFYTCLKLFLLDTLRQIYPSEKEVPQ